MAMMTNTIAMVIQNGSQVFMTPPTLDGEEGEEGGGKSQGGRRREDKLQFL